MECKIVGVNFTKCNALLLEINFSKCLVNDCNFSNLKLHNTSFRECTINESDFVGADLTGSDFFKSSLKGSLFHNTNLSKVNLVDAKDFAINPLTNKLHKARLSIPEAMTLLEYLGVVIE